MSQNFSEMSNIYIPELMELDSYWQKAVEDAVCDTLKGEKRLYYALKNRKKIKQKLEMLGLKTTNTQISLSALSRGKLGSPEEAETSVSSSERSMTQEEVQDDLAGPERRPKRNSRQNAISEKRLKTPDRPFLAGGSMEKMKKSQNSFNCEPMGFDYSDPMESDNGDELNEVSEEDDEEEKNKKVEWLHVRRDSDFECSDSETPNLGMEDFQKGATVKDKNYFIRNPLRLSKPSEEEQYVKSQSSRSDSQWDTESEDAFSTNPELEKRLHLALAKREILNDNLNAMSIGTNRIEVEVCGSAVKLAEKRMNARAFLPPYTRFYLDVYREFCHKCTLKEIADEAGRRWWNMSPKEKSLYADFMSAE